jgi:alkylation response protein AidB-like acyl-CoA dehydrogenase
MSLLIDDDVKMLRESAAKLFADAEPVKKLRQQRSTQDVAGAGRGVWQDMVALGLPGMLLPVAAGGAGLGMMASVQIAEVLGRNLAGGPFLSTVIMGAVALRDSADAALLERLAAGDLLLGIATDEAARHHPGEISSHVQRGSGGFVLSGRKLDIIGGNIADLLIVSARDENGAPGLFLVPAGGPGLDIKTSLGLDTRPVVSIDFNNAPATQLCAPDLAVNLLAQMLDAGRLHLAAEMLGLAQEAFDRTVEYLKIRVQFGRPIGSFQALQHRAALLFGALEISRSVVAKAAWICDHSPAEAPRYVALAKAKLSAVARHVTAEAVQLHGGIGVTDDFDLGFYLKRAQRAANQLGDYAWSLERYAQLRGL